MHQCCLGCLPPCVGMTTPVIAIPQCSSTVFLLPFPLLSNHFQHFYVFFCAVFILVCISTKHKSLSLPPSHTYWNSAQPGKHLPMVWQSYHQQGKIISYQKKQEFLLPSIFFPRKRNCADTQSPKKVTMRKREASMIPDWEKRDNLRSPWWKMERTRLLRFLYQIGLTNTVQHHFISSFSDKGKLQFKPSLSQGEGCHNCEYQFYSKLWKDLKASCINAGKDLLGLWG